MKSKTELFTPRPGNPAEGQGFWINVQMADRIRSKCNRAMNLLALFYILNMLMAEAKSRTFDASVEQLAKRSGLKPRAILRHLNGLQYCGVISFKSNESGESFRVTILGEVRL